MNQVGDVLERLCKAQPRLEQLLVESLEPLVREVERWPRFEREMSLEDLLNLSGSKDAMYDRPATGVTYALWYHPRRMHDAVRTLLPTLMERTGDLRIIDMGAGTGATWWAVMAIERTRQLAGCAPRRVHIDAIESSTVMLDTARRMWSTVERRFGSSTYLPTVRHALHSVGVRLSRVDRSIGYLGYFFDASDETRAEAVGGMVARSLAVAGADCVLLAGTSVKSAVSNRGANGIIAAASGARKDLQLPDGVWRGEIEELGGLRRRIAHDFVNQQRRDWGCRAPTWSWTNEPEALRITIKPVIPDQLDFDNPGSPMLDHVQDVAAQPEPRLTAVIGAAGSGKSLVLVERLARLLVRTPAGNPVRAMVTTFNRNMIEQLAEWFARQEPNVGGLRREPSAGDSDILFTLKRTGHTVRFINWDKVPTRLFGIQHATTSPNDSFGKLLENPTARQSAALREVPWASADFLADEFQRFVYGHRALTVEEYIKLERVGAGRPVRRESRRALWALFELRDRDRCLTDVRFDMLRRVLQGRRPRNTFTHIFVDECQDFLRSDFRALEHLIEDPMHLCVFGDQTQGLRLGAAYTRPGMVGNRIWKKHLLEGSYRLPIRVCEAVAPIADHLERVRSSAPRPTDGAVVTIDIVRPEAVKHATQGTRPILVAGSNKEVGSQLRDIVTRYRSLLEVQPGEARIVSIAEGSESLVTAAENAVRMSLAHLQPQYATQPEKMVKIKGLERPFVIWSTRSVKDEKDTLAEWVYTILTRTTALLVIVLSPDTDPSVRSVVARMDRDRVMPWTEAAADLFDEWQRANVGNKHDPLR